MNALIKFLIVSAVVVGALALFSVFTLTFFGSQVAAVTFWLVDALVPFKGLINLAALALFVTELMGFEVLWWSYILVDKVVTIYTGASLRQTARLDAQDEHVYANRDKYRQKRY